MRRSRNDDAREFFQATASAESLGLWNSLAVPEASALLSPPATVSFRLVASCRYFFVSRRLHCSEAAFFSSLGTCVADARIPVIFLFVRRKFSGSSVFQPCAHQLFVRFLRPNRVRKRRWTLSTLKEARAELKFYGWPFFLEIGAQELNTFCSW